ncbi:GDSL-like Lipase/Acylhydrolase, partial [Thozetella sp. PMI_491]
MPLGASVTFGTGSSTGNSYRKDLRDMLVQAGFEVNMVGQKKNGNFTDDDVEATGGFVIAQIANASKVATPMFKPNLVLVDAGTNNCNNGGTQPQAGHDVAAMIDNMYAASPGVTVILTTILQNKIAEQDACRVDINAQYQTLATNFTQKGAKFLLVDMRNGGPTVNDLADTRHPNDAGYQKMANVWFKGIQEVVSKGFLVAP